MFVFGPVMPGSRDSSHRSLQTGHHGGESGLGDPCGNGGNR